MSNRTYQDVVRANLKRLRGSLRQDELAARARAAGLKWSQATVAAIERGHRKVSAEEEKLLAALLDVGLDELLRVDEDEQIDVAGVTVEGYDFTRWPLGEQVQLEGSQDEAEPLVSVTADEARSFAPVARRYGLADDLDSLVSIKADALGVTSEKAARSLGVWTQKRRAFEVAAAARSLWGRSLAKERDARLERLRAHADQQDLRAARGARGHMTRQLLKELAEHIRAHGGRRRSS